jgi:hypothetical protein
VATSAKKLSRARKALNSRKTVIDRGIRILRMSGKRSAIAEQICDALWATSEPPRGKTTHS